MIQNCDIFRDAHHHFHIVLDQQDRDAQIVAHALDQRHRVCCFQRVHAGSRLVQEHELRIGRQSPCNLQSPLKSVGKVLGERLAFAAQSNIRQQLLSALVRLGLLLHHRPQSQQCAVPSRFQAAVHADQHILESGHVAEETDILEGPSQPQRSGAIGTQAADLLAIEQHLTRRRSVKAGDHVEKGRLASAVRADQTGDRAFLDIEVESAHRGQAAKMLADFSSFQQGHGDLLRYPLSAGWSVSSSAACSSARRAALGKSPSGLTNMMTTIAKPKKNHRHRERSTVASGAM